MGSYCPVVTEFLFGVPGSAGRGEVERMGSYCSVVTEFLFGVVKF